MKDDMIKIHKFPGNNTKPITILSLGHPMRAKRTVDRIITPLLNSDPVSRNSIAYWLIEVEEDENGIYNGQRAYNDALWECESPMVIFSTGDVIIPGQLLWRAYGVYLESGQPVIAMRADQIAENSNEATGNNHATGDFILTPREWAVETGGWDERLTDWGLHDYIFLALLEAAGHPPIVLGERWNDRGIHLWHPKKEESWYREQNNKNKALINSLPMWTKADFLASRSKREDVTLVSA